MRIYERVVIDIGSGEVLEEESFEYEGPVAWCGGSGGGGGGGSSGDVDYPTYMKEVQENWLRGTNLSWDGAEVDPSESLTQLIQANVGSSPYSGKSAYDPSSRVSNIDSAVSDFKSYLDSIDTSSGVELELSSFLPSETKLVKSVKAAFDRGYAIVADGLAESKISARNNLASLTVEGNRINIVTKSEENATNRKITQKDSLWDLEIYQTGGNVLASISGGTAMSKGGEEGPSDTQKAIGGGLSGAAAGATIGSSVMAGTQTGASAGGVYGAIIGAVVGAGAALLSS